MKIAIFGSSGFSRETGDVCLVVGYHQLVFIDPCPHQSRCMGFPVVDESAVPQLQADGFHFSIGIGDNATRKTIRTRHPDLHYPTLIHPSATFGHLQKEALMSSQGTIVTAGVRFTDSIDVGNFCIFNLNCTIGHDCVIDNYVNIGPGANLSGNVYAKAGAYIGTNACILQGKTTNQKMTVGSYAIVGAGSVVTKSVPDQLTVRGVPAR